MIDIERARSMLGVWLPLAAIAATFIQGLLLIVWLTHLNWQISYIAGQHIEIARRVGALDDTGGRAASAINVRLGSIENANSVQDARTQSIERLLNDVNVSLTGTSYKLEGKIGALDALFKRLDEQQMRIIQALDSMYDEQQRHMRDRGLHPSVPPP